MSLGDSLRDVAEELRRNAERVWGDVRREPSTALAELTRPNLGSTPEPLRRVLEPVVATAALVVVGGLAGVGIAALAAFFAAAALIYAIMTYVFGIEVDLAGMPTGA